MREASLNAWVNGASIEDKEVGLLELGCSYKRIWYSVL